MELEKTIIYLEVVLTEGTVTKFTLFDFVNAIGLELTRGNQRGVLLDLFETDGSEEIIETIKSGLRISFPFLPNIYLACINNDEKPKPQEFDAGFITKEFNDRTIAIDWLHKRLN